MEDYKIKKLIEDNLTFNKTSLDFASVKYFAESGNVSGELFLRIKAIINKTEEGLVKLPYEIDVKTEVIDRLGRKCLNNESELGITRTVWWEKGFNECLDWLRQRNI